ncbi:ArsB/NhaD family transporter [Victivallaceae bacterium BBE-744-WT-12]|uniref:ArsB/NhaD family transporter n=1 Tax=Victivallis lenta TaxID=2606640 RepID=A0A844G0Y9_9BACT|nr:ArsB/NhaD family transporter [Victivallis lenta]MST97267.1 ArsB/NhaD family transporter [Victivallis lenta]
MFASNLFFGAAEAASELAGSAAGSTHMWIGVAIFAAAYLFIASEKVDKTIAAMLGAGLMIALGVAGFNDMLGKIDLNVLGLLIGMMVIVNIMATTGVFEYLAVKIARQTKGNGVLVVMEFLLATAFISAFMDNVTTVILMAPVTILITQLLRLPTVPILIMEAIFSNIGGTATLIGDPPNILIGASCNLSFNDFLINLTPVVLIVMAVTLGVVLLQMRKNLRTAPSAVAQVRLTEPKLAILEPARLSRSMWVFAFVLLGFFTSRLTGLEPGIIAICGAFVMALVCKIELSHMLEKVEWNTILFFSGLFMMVGALEIDGVFNSLGQWMIHMTDGNFALTMMIILWGSAILSAVIDNIPLVISMIPLIQSIVPIFAGQMGIAGSEELITAQIREPLFWALALGACLGGNGTLIGASANVVVCQIARKNRYPVTFWQFTRYGFPLMILSVAICSVYLYFRYIF